MSPSLFSSPCIPSHHATIIRLTNIPSPPSQLPHSSNPQHSICLSFPSFVQPHPPLHTVTATHPYGTHHPVGFHPSHYFILLPGLSLSFTIPSRCATHCSRPRHSPHPEHTLPFLLRTSTPPPVTIDVCHTTFLIHSASCGYTPIPTCNQLLSIPRFPSYASSFPLRMCPIPPSLHHQLVVHTNANPNAAATPPSVIATSSCALLPHFTSSLRVSYVPHRVRQSPFTFTLHLKHSMPGILSCVLNSVTLFSLRKQPLPLHLHIARVLSK